MNPFFLVSQAAPSTTEAIEGLLGVETLGSIGGVVFIIYGMYKLGTVEAVLKLILGVLVGIVVLYAAGYLAPQLQTSSWYQLIAYIVERVPELIINSLEGSGI